MINAETELIVPDVITLKSDAAERKIRLEDCQNQNEIMEYLKICLSLCTVNYPERILEDLGKATRTQTNYKNYRELPDTASTSKLVIA